MLGDKLDGSATPIDALGALVDVDAGELVDVDELIPLGASSPPKSLFPPLSFLIRGCPVIGSISMVG
jgi:hypothetical protein